MIAAGVRSWWGRERKQGSGIRKACISLTRSSDTDWRHWLGTEDPEVDKQARPLPPHGILVVDMHKTNKGWAPTRTDRGKVIRHGE